MINISFYRYKLGERIFVILSDFNLIKKAFNKEELSGRPDFFSIKIMYNFNNVGKFYIS